MPVKSRAKPKSVALKSAELAFAVPQVVVHRLARMALTGPTISTRDRREFQNMVSEKQTAFSQAWLAMAAETVRMNQSIAMSLFSGMLPSHSRIRASSTQLAKSIAIGTKAIASKGLTPIHRKAVANAQRLGKTRTR